MADNLRRMTLKEFSKGTSEARKKQGGRNKEKKKMNHII